MAVRLVMDRGDSVTWLEPKGNQRRGDAMISRTIAEIEARIRDSEAVPETTRSELLELVGALRDELPGVDEAHSEQAESVARLAGLSTHEATRSSRNPELLGLSIEGLSRSVKEFEASHPKLAKTVNAFAAMLSDIGI
jgi:hypothetical protein